MCNKYIYVVKKNICFLKVQIRVVIKLTSNAKNKDHVKKTSRFYNRKDESFKRFINAERFSVNYEIILFPQDNYFLR